MAIQSRTRKRVLAIRRAPDGSAFEKCGHCGESVAIALVDMHDCETKMEPAKRFRGLCANLLIRNGVATQAIADQPRSAFCFFMEKLEEEFGGENLDDLNRIGFETWKKLPAEERQPYITRAKKVNGAYLETSLLGEVNNVPKVEDEADSAMVGKFDEFLEDYEDHDYSGSWKVSPSFDGSRSR